MLRLVLLVLYLIASSFASPDTERVGTTDPLGLNALPLASTTERGAGYDPDGASASPPAVPTSDSGGGYDPNG
jgi:hypothetical protein